MGLAVALLSSLLQPPVLGQELPTPETRIVGSSPLGTVFRYGQCLEGSDSPASFLRRVKLGAAQWRELSEGWVAAELGAPPAVAALEGLRIRLLGDLPDLALYGWMTASGLIDRSDREQRVLQFLEERGYFSPGEAPLTLSPDVWSILAHRALARQRIALDPADEQRLAGLVTLDARSLAHTERFQRWLVERELCGDGASCAALQRAALERESSAYLASRFPLALEVGTYALLPQALTRTRAAPVTLTLTVPPIETNGRWNAATHRLEWEPDARAATLVEGTLPRVLYAVWAEPDAAFQRARFGRVLLTGASLRAYDDWYADAVDSDQRAAWDDFVASLSPGPALLERIESFRFSDDPTERTSKGELKPSRAEPAISLLGKALRGAKDEAKP